MAFSLGCFDYTKICGELAWQSFTMDPLEHYWFIGIVFFKEIFLIPSNMFSQWSSKKVGLFYNTSDLLRVIIIIVITSRHSQQSTYLRWRLPPPENSAFLTPYKHKVWFSKCEVFWGPMLTPFEFVFSINSTLSKSDHSVK